jgi:ribosomal protein S13
MWCYFGVICLHFSCSVFETEIGIFMEDSCKTEFGKRLDNFNQSPEMKIYQNLQALKSSFRVFEGNFHELMQFLKHLEDSRESLTKYASDQKENLELLIEETSRLLHNFLASAQSLVEHMKIIVDNNTKKHSNSREFKKEYQIKLDQDIKNNPLYIFVKKLRNHTLHQALPVLALSMIFADDLRFSMRIDIKTFKQWDSWRGAKNDLETIEDTLCIADLVNKYFMLICDFYTWLTERQQNIYQPDIEKLQKMKKEMDEEFMM